MSVSSGNSLRPLSCSAKGGGALPAGGAVAELESTAQPYSPPRNTKSNLKFLRRSRGFTLEALSELTGISPSYLSRLEAGARRLNSDLLERLSAVLGCHQGDLLNNDNGSRRSAWRASGTPHGFAHIPAGGFPDQRITRPPREQAPIPAAPQKDLPVYSVSMASEGIPGAGGEAPSIDLTNPADWAFRPHQLLGVRTAFALYVRDEENAPKYMPGDMLFVHPTKPLSLGCSIVAITKDDRAMIRQFVSWGADSILVSPFTTSKNAGLRVRSIPRIELLAVYKIIGTLEGHSI